MHKITTIFFDLDGTLYSYSTSHEEGLRGAYDYWQVLTNESYPDFIRRYKNGRQRVKRFLEGTSGSHSRVLYFQAMVEEYYKSSKPFHIAELTQRYWDAFLRSIKPFDGVVETLQQLKDSYYKLGIITNMSSEIQFRKLHRLNLDNFFEVVITSEEAGKEKPHPHIYLHALDRLDVKPFEAIMVGDSWEHDIEVTEFLGMEGILVEIEGNKEHSAKHSITQFSEIFEVLKEFNSEPLDGVIKYELQYHKKNLKISPGYLDEMIKLRDKLHKMNLIGVYPADHSRTPNIGFGNISERYTDDGQFFVSGTQTGHLDKTNFEDYCLVMDFDVANNRVISKGPLKPSSESMTHAAIYDVAPEVNCVIHVHYEDMWDRYSEFNMLTTPKEVPYGTPEMARAIQKVYTDSPKLTKPVCLLGHQDGLIVWGETREEAYSLLKEVYEKL